jgi:hypothetical protein
MGAASVRQPVLGLAVGWGVLLSLAFLSPHLLSSDDPADVVTRQTARVAVLFWAVAAVLLLRRERRPARWIWLFGCAAFLVHVATAFDQVHGWSHAKAFQHVEDTSGFGPGIFVSYAFTILWILDAAWWMLRRASYDARPRWLDWTIHGAMAFVVFNGTVVYETGFIRWAGAALFVALAVSFLLRNWARPPASVIQNT